jgi:hypothetical protein
MRRIGVLNALPGMAGPSRGVSSGFAGELGWIVGRNVRMSRITMIFAAVHESGVGTQEKRQ